MTYLLQLMHTVLGHILTRIVYKGTVAFAILKQYDKELEVLEALLTQRRWGRGRRGQWYDRRALILMTHYAKDEKTTIHAINCVAEALRDPDTRLSEYILCRI